MSKEIHKAGFDMSFVELEELLELFEDMGIDTEANIERYSHDDEVAFVRGQIRSFKFYDEQGNMVVFGCNPFKGVDRYGYEVEKGYASYVGIEGSPEFVKEFGGWWYENADWKDVSPHSRDFI